MKACMECLRLLIISGLLFNAALTTESQNLSEDCTSDPLKYRLPVTIAECRHYNVELMPTEVDEMYGSYRGRGSYIVTIYQATKNISLHTYQLLDTETIRLTRHFDLEVYKAVDYAYCPTTHIFRIGFHVELTPGNYTLDIAFEGLISFYNLRGFAKLVYLENGKLLKSFLTTNFLWDARELFPCWDEPAQRATFNISVKYSPSYTVLSNMPVDRRERFKEEERDTMLTYFHTTPLIPPHQVGIVMSNDLVCISNDNNFVNVCGRRRVKKKLKLAHKIAQQFSAFIRWYLNINVTVPKVNYIAIPPSQLHSKYSWGLHTFEESALAYEPNIERRPFSQKTHLVYRLGQAVAHQWFLGMLSPSWWNHVWLNNGIAEFLGMYITNKFFKESRVIDHFVVERQHLALAEDIAFRVGPVIRQVQTPKEIEFLLSSVAQQKAIAIIRMMYHIISDEVFRRTISLYLQEHQFKSTTPDDLWKAFKQSTNQCNQYDLNTVMTNWLTSANYPLVKVARMRNFNRRIIITQEFLYKPEREENRNLWWIPITYATRSKPNFNKTLPNVWLTLCMDYTNIYNIPEDDWIIVNLQQIGFYRVNYDMDNWQKLASYLKSDEYTKIHPINRAQLIDDSYHLMLAGHLNFSVFLQLTSYLKKETDYIPWYPMEAIFSNMSIFFQMPESAPIKTHMADILSVLLENIGYEKDDDSDLIKSLRLLTLKWACEFGQFKCLKTAKNLLSAFLDNPEENEIPPTWRNWVFCMGMMKANQSMWMKMLNKYSQTKETVYVEYLNCAEDPSIIIDYIDMLASENILLQNSGNRLEIVHHIIAKHATKTSVLDYILTNYDRLNFLKEPSTIAEIIISIYRPEQFEKVRKFAIDNFSANKSHLKHLISSIEQRSNQIQTEMNMFADLFSINRK